jgi:hypothetical protein
MLKNCLVLGKPVPSTRECEVVKVVTVKLEYQIAAGAKAAETRAAQVRANFITAL